MKWILTGCKQIGSQGERKERCDPRLKVALEDSRARVDECKLKTCAVSRDWMIVNTTQR